MEERLQSDQRLAEQKRNLGNKQPNKNQRFSEAMLEKDKRLSAEKRSSASSRESRMMDKTSRAAEKAAKEKRDEELRRIIKTITEAERIVGMFKTYHTSVCIIMHIVTNYSLAQPIFSTKDR